MDVLRDRGWLRSWDVRATPREATVFQVLSFEAFRNPATAS